MLVDQQDDGDEQQRSGDFVGDFLDVHAGSKVGYGALPIEEIYSTGYLNASDFVNFLSYRNNLQRLLVFATL